MIQPDAAGMGTSRHAAGGIYQQGASRYLFATRNKFAAFFAVARNGATWAGSVGPVNVKSVKFDSCIGIGSSGGFNVGMQLIELPWYRGVPGSFKIMTLH